MLILLTYAIKPDKKIVQLYAWNPGVFQRDAEITQRNNKQKINLILKIRNSHTFQKHINT